MLLIRLSLLISIFLAGPIVRAQELYEPIQTIRQLGMGGVYVFNEGDSASFFQNPAYTCYTEGFNFQIFNIGMGVGDLGAVADLSANSGTVPSPSGFTGLSPYFGKNLWLNVGGHTSITLPCFGFGGYYNGVTSFSLQNPAFPVMKTQYLSEYSIQTGFAVPIGSLLSVGVDIKRVNRTGGPLDLGPETLVNLSDANSLTNLVSQFQNAGVGYGVDAGVVSRFSMLPFNPTLSVSWRDVGATAFQMTGGADAPERQKDNLVAGLTFDGSIPLLGVAGGVEYRHINDTGVQIGKKLHAGVELSLAFLDARAGFHQGYTTYGVGLDFWLIQMDAAWYKVEKGAYPGQTPDERAQFGLRMQLEFDPNFNLVDTGGKKRRLKQRR